MTRNTLRTIHLSCLELCEHLLESMGVITGPVKSYSGLPYRQGYPLADFSVFGAVFSPFLCFLGGFS